MLCDVCTYFKELLILAGDVETNPGPDLDELFKQLEIITGDLKEIKEQRLTAIDNKLERLTSLDNKVSSCMAQVFELQKTVSALEMKLDDLENRSRRSNLLVYGVPEEAEENADTLEKAVNQKIVKEILKVEPVDIERIHRIGKPDGKKVRPVILKLLDFRDKNLILKNCHKLKGTNFSIGEDFSARVRDIRKKLWIVGRPRKESGDKVSLLYDKPGVNGDLYRWDEETNDAVLLTTKPRTSEEEKNEPTRSQRPRRAPPRKK